MQTCALWALKTKCTKAESNRDIQAYANVNRNKIWDDKEFVIHWFFSQLLNDTFINLIKTVYATQFYSNHKCCYTLLTSHSNINKQS